MSYSYAPSRRAQLSAHRQRRPGVIMANSDRSDIRDTPSSISYLEDGIVITRLKDHAVVDLEEAQRLTRVLAELTEGRAAPLLVDFGKMQRQTKEARDYFSKDPDHTQLYTAAALLVRNPMAKVFANFYMGINRPLRPTKMFTDRDRALEWLGQFK